jgi:hypothetical protein
MLFDPAKKQLHAPACAIQFGNSECGEQEVVGQKNQPQVFLGIEVMDAAQRIGIQERGLRPGELNGLIGSQPGGKAHRPPVAPPELGVLFGARDEKSATLFEHIQTREAQVAAVEQIKSSRFGQQLVQNVDVVHRAAGHINIGRNAAAQIEQSMHFDRTLVTTELRPGKHRQTQIDGGGVQRIEGLVQLHAQRFVAIQQASLGDERPREIAEDAPVARFVGVRQCVARDAAAKTQMIKLGLLRAQTGFDIAQAFAPGELREGQAKKLIPAGETLHFVIAPVTFHAATEFRPGKKIHHLSKNRSATVHAALPSQLRSGSRVAVNSNRFRSFSCPNPAFAASYGISRFQHWDSIVWEFIVGLPSAPRDLSRKPTCHSTRWVKLLDERDTVIVKNRGAL